MTLPKHSVIHSRSNQSLRHPHQPRATYLITTMAIPAYHINHPVPITPPTAVREGAVPINNATARTTVDYASTLARRIFSAVPTSVAMMAGVNV